MLSARIIRKQATEMGTKHSSLAASLVQVGRVSRTLTFVSAVPGLPYILVTCYAYSCTQQGLTFCALVRSLCVCVCVCVFACVCAHTHAHTHTHTHTHIYIYICVYMYLGATLSYVTSS